jgi:hypothetical protein
VVLTLYLRPVQPAPRQPREEIIAPQA